VGGPRQLEVGTDVVGPERRFCPVVLQPALDVQAGASREVEEAKSRRRHGSMVAAVEAVGVVQVRTGSSATVGGGARRVPDMTDDGRRFEPDLPPMTTGSPGP